MPNDKSKLKTYLFIDGTNLYASQYELFGSNKYLHFPSFIKEIENNLKIKFNQIYFYASYSPQSKKPTKKEKLYLKNEALFYRDVKRTKNVLFFRGYRSPTSGKEKEVDVKLAVDIVDFAHQKCYDQIFLLAGDADFMEALKVPRRLNIPVYVICMENRIMFKSIIFYKTFIIKFSNKKIEIKKIRKKPIYIFLEKDKIVNKI